MRVSKIKIVVVGIVAVGAGMYFFGDRAPRKPVWQVACAQQVSETCRLYYEIRLKNRDKFRINIALLGDSPLFGLSAKGGACKNRPWTLQVDQHAAESFLVGDLGALGGMIEPDRAKEIIAQMRTGSAAVVKLSRQPACEREEITVALEHFGSSYEDLLKIMAVLEDGKIERGEWQ